MVSTMKQRAGLLQTWCLLGMARSAFVAFISFLGCFRYIFIAVCAGLHSCILAFLTVFTGAYGHLIVMKVISSCLKSSTEATFVPLYLSWDPAVLSGILYMLFLDHDLGRNCPFLWGAGVAAVPKAPETAAKSYDLHLTSSYKTQTS